MSATLKDLAPAEKQKVARLIQQVVEKERQLRDLEAAAGGRESSSTTAAAAAKAGQLAEQNQELARDNTSLRAKLSHAFDLLRAYQHKCRVLEATVQVAGAASSRPSTPGWGPDLLPGLLGLNTNSTSNEGSIWGGEPDCLLPEQEEAVGAAVSAAPTCGKRVLSPVAEGLWEGASPGQPAAAPAAAVSGSQQLPVPWVPLPPPSQPASRPGTAGASSGASSQGCSIQLVAPDAVLPQLEALKLMAQALLEAQAEVAAKQAAAQHCAPPTLQQVQHCPQQSAAAGVAGRHGDGSPPCLHPHGGAAQQQQGQQQARPAGQEACGSVLGSESPATQVGPAGQARVPLAALGHQQQQQQQQQYMAQTKAPQSASAHSSCGCSLQVVAPAGGDAASPGGPRGHGKPSVVSFEGDLLDLVQEVEWLGCADRGDGGAGRHRRCHLAPGSDGGSSVTRQEAALYEENDLLDLIAQL